MTIKKFSDIKVGMILNDADSTNNRWIILEIREEDRVYAKQLVETNIASGFSSMFHFRAFKGDEDVTSEYTRLERLMYGID